MKKSNSPSECARRPLVQCEVNGHVSIQREVSGSLDDRLWLYELDMGCLTNGRLA